MSPENIPKSLGRYEIRSVIGRGMMGVVYEAVDPALGRTVALKTIQVAFGISEQERKVFEERFFTEARLAAGISHPNIVVVHDVGWDEPTGTPFMALEFLHGQTLGDRLDAEGRIDWRESLRITARVADALHVAHAAGVVHRDVKPANIMLLPSGEPKIMDFGIAKAPASRLTMAGDVFGTPSYMSPEQASGVEVDGRSDIFSLGTILYQMLTGRRAFDAANVPAILARVTHEAPESPLALVPGLPAALEPLLARCLAKDPVQRYPDGRSLVEDLEDVLAGRPLRPRPGLAQTLGEPTASPEQRRTAVARDASKASPRTLAEVATASYVGSAQGMPAAEPPVSGESRRSAAGPALVLIGLVAIAAIAGTVAVLAVGGGPVPPGPREPVETADAGPPPAAPDETTPPAPGTAEPTPEPPRAQSERPRSEPRRAEPTPEPEPRAPADAAPTPAAEAAPPTPRPTPEATPPARLAVRVDHSLPSGEFRIRALTEGPGTQGQLVFRRHLEGEEEKRLGIFRTHRGELERTIEVPVGEYYLRVEAERDGKVRPGMIRGDFRSGRTLTLEVRVRGSGLELEWK